MKVRSKLITPKASSLFTDREEPRIAFWHKYDTVRRTLDSGDIHVLTYYGIGGIGKSSLLKKLMEEMDERLEDPGYVYYDLNLSQDSRTVLKALKNKLESAYKFRFPLFELALYFYGKKVGEDVKAPEAGQLAKKSPLVELAMDLLGETPLLGSTVKFLELTDKGVSVLRTYLKNHKRELDQLQGQEPEEVLQRLPEFFALDLQRNLEDQEQPLVIFLDTYERLVNEMEASGESLEKDLWLRGENGLVQNVSGVLWVIAGREKLKWAKFDHDWESAMEQHLLGNLSAQDSTQFLALAGVEEEALRSQLYELTGGTPVYLDLCVGQYHNIRSRGEQPEIGLFGNDTQSLIQRFARYMDDSHKDLVYLMSALQRWNDSLFFDLADRVLPGFSPTTYEKVKEFSFIIQADEEEYNIHQTVGDVLWDDCPKALARRLTGKALAFFEEKLQEMEAAEETYTEFLQYLLQFAQLHYENDYDLQEWFGKGMPVHLGELRRTGMVERVEQVLAGIRPRAEKRPVSLLYARFRMEEALNASAWGNSAEALAAAENAWNLAQGISGKKSLIYARSLEIAAQTALAMEHRKDALRHAEEAVALQEELQGKDAPETLRAAMTLVKSRLAAGDFERALEELLPVLERMRKNDAMLDDLLRAENTHAALLSFVKRKEEALALWKELEPRYVEYFGEDHLQTSMIRYNIAGSLRAFGKREEGRNLRWEVYETRLKTLGETHQKTLMAQRRVAKDLEEDGDPEMARILLERASTAYWEVWGPENKKTLDVLRYYVNFLRTYEFQKYYLYYWESCLRKAELAAKNTGVTLDEEGNLRFEVQTKPETDPKGTLQQEIKRLKERVKAMEEEKARMEAYYAAKKQ
ncbi:MAG: tetratricopeptide repeat protein [Clostridiales bacterium]|nr:tetratricopeptide repeat protein [Clostridiales bacterium]